MTTFTRKEQMAGRRADIALANSNFARAREAIVDSQRALDLVTGAIAIRPKVVKFYLLRLHLHLRLRLFEEALSDSNAAVRLDSRSPAAHCGRGLCLRKLGHLEAALSEFDKAVELSGAGRARYCFYRGSLLFDLRRWGAAADDFGTAAQARGAR